MAGWLGRRLGDAIYAALPRRRRLAAENLRRAFPDMPERDRRRIARHSCQHLGLVVVELCALLARPLDDWMARIRVEGREHLDRVMAAHGRALVVSAHLGNWELLALAHRLTPYRLSVVARPLDSPALNRLAGRLRERAGVTVIDKRQAIRPVLRALGEGQVVGILLDQNAARAEGVFVPFFGHPASTSRSIAVLAARTRTPVVPIFARREGGGRHAVVIRPAIHWETSGEAEPVEAMTRACTAAIEAAVRETPEQWLWLHDRWRTRPRPEGS